MNTKTIKLLIVSIVSFSLVFPIFAEKFGNLPDSAMDGLSEGVKEHLTLALTEIAKTDTGKFILNNVSPQVKFSTKPMPQLGFASANNMITLEALRLDKGVFATKQNITLTKTKICFTTEILSHELLHNAQGRAGLFNYPQGCSGFEAVLCEKLLELQAKYVGETMYQATRRQEEYMPYVQSKPNLLSVMQSQSKNPTQEYLETLWQNKRTSSTGRRLYQEQIAEIIQWNAAYAEQAFRNNYVRFREDLKGVGDEAIKQHLTKIIQFVNLPITADFLLKNACVRPIPHGIACYENDVKVLEYEAVQEGYIVRKFAGQTVKEMLVRVTLQPSK